MESNYSTSQSVNVYCCTVENTVKTCLQYIANSKHLLLEVPFEQYEAVVEGMMEQQKNKEATFKHRIKKGAFTYAQMKHITLARNIHGLTMDEEGRIYFINDAISISAATAFAQSKWNGAQRKVAIENGVYTGLAVLQEAFAEEVMISQFHHHHADDVTELYIGKESQEKGEERPSKKFASSMIKKIMKHSVAMKRNMKLMHTKYEAGALVTGRLSTTEIVQRVNEKMSSQHLFKHVAKTTASMIGGVMGVIIGGSIGLSIPNVSTAIVSFIGGMIGMFIGSSLASKLTKRVLDFFIHHDALQMLAIFNERLIALTEEYLLNSDELTQALLDFETLYNMPKTLREMRQVSDQQQFADSIIHCELTRIIKLRMYLRVPTNEEIFEVLEPMIA